MEWTQAHNSFKHFPKEFLNSNFHTLLALKKNKFVKDNRWFPPPPGWVKLNFDGSVKEEARVASYGALLQDCSGNIIWSFHGTLQLMKQSFGPSIMEAETPSMSSTIWRNPTSSPWQWTHLWDGIDKSLCGKEVSFIHIHRERNGSADAIARGVGL
ncbi:hypothetical protein AMTRI_Chr09g40520 [Amborella trichopoda]